MRRNVYNQAPEYVSYTIDHHQVVNELPVCSGGGGLEFEEGKGRGGAQNGVDAEPDRDCAEDIGDDGKNRRLGEGGHFACNILRTGFGQRMLCRI